MNYSPTQWYKIGLSAAFGKDKLSFDERLAWYQGNERSPDPAEAEEPAYALAMMDGLSGNRQVRVHLDATASG